MIRLLLLLSLLSAGCSARLNPFEPVDGTDQQVNSTKKGVDLNNPDATERTVKLVTDKNEAQKETKKEPSKPPKNDQKEQLATDLKKPQERKAIESTPTIKKVEDAAAAVAPKKSEVMAQEAPQKSTKECDCSPKTKSVTSKKIKSKKSKAKQTKTKFVAKASKMKKTMATKTKSTNTKYKVLPLVTIDLMGDNLAISTRDNYKLIQYYEEPKENKFVFDFKASVGIPTERGDITSPYYDSYTVGNHPEEGFFRVVIPVKDGVSHYKVLIKDNKGTIIRK